MLYGIIPISIRRNKMLSDRAKLVYCEITANMNEKSECRIGNEPLCEIFGVTDSSITKYIKELKEAEAICVTQEGAERVITIPERMVVFDKSQQSKKKKQDKKVELAKEVVSVWNEIMGVRIRVTNELISAVTARSKSFSEEEIIKALRSRKEFVDKSDWHNQPENQRHRNNVYLVIRSDKELEKYLTPIQGKKKNEVKLIQFD